MKNDSNEVKDYFNNFKSISSKEISRLTLYISFGIITSTFTIFKDFPSCILNISMFFSMLCIILHFIQYACMYEVSKKYMNYKKYSVPHNIYKVTDWIMLGKIIILIISVLFFWFYVAMQLTTLTTTCCV